MFNIYTEKHIADLLFLQEFPSKKLELIEILKNLNF